MSGVFGAVGYTQQVFLVLLLCAMLVLGLKKHVMVRLLVLFVLPNNVYFCKLSLHVGVV